MHNMVIIKDHIAMYTILFFIFKDLFFGSLV